VHVSMGMIIGVKRLERQADNSPPSSAWFRMCGPILLLPLYAFMTWTDNFTVNSRNKRLGCVLFLTARNGFCWISKR